ncbi:MAG: hypothetical protein ABIR79_04445 [Candidatus Binatia bacterium]
MIARIARRNVGTGSSRAPTGRCRRSRAPTSSPTRAASRQRTARIHWDDAGEILLRRTGTFATLIADYAYRLLQPGFDPFAPLPTTLANADRLVTAAVRNRGDNPASFAPAAWLCINGDDDTACAAARAIAAARPELRRAALRLERRRTADSD